MNEHHDPVERAFEALRREHASEPPDPALEARLRERFPRARGRTRRFLVPGLTLAVLSGAAFAGGWGWIERWWFEVEVDGTRASGALGPDGDQTLAFETASGGTATVRVRKDATETGAERTRIDLTHRDGQDVEEERFEEVFGDRAPVLLPATERATGTLLHRGESDGEPQALYLLPAGEVLPGEDPDAERRPRLVLHRERSAPDVLEELARPPVFVLEDGARIEVTANEAGGYDLVVRRGGHEYFITVGRGSDLSVPRASELKTDDGRFRVRVEPTPERR